jgi:hypothetical protein
MKSAAWAAIILAQQHVSEGMTSSAKVCVDDAVTCYNVGSFELAVRRAIDSLKYSVGIMSPIYAKVVHAHVESHRREAAGES